MKIQVYKNLHNGKWSLRDSKTKLVLGHADKVLLSDVTSVVKEVGRQKVLADKQKNVHAYVEGTLEAAEGFVSYKGRQLGDDYWWWYKFADSNKSLAEIYYNPYDAGKFMSLDLHSGIVSDFDGCEYLELTDKLKVLGY